MQTLRLLLQLIVLLGLSGVAVCQCSNTSYGNGVVCIGGFGAGGDNANQTTKTVFYSPTAGHAIIAAAYTCADRNCQNVPTTTLSIGDNLHNPEPCFQKSPGSPFALNETSAGSQKLQDYIWVCPRIPSGVTSFTITCSLPFSCSYPTVTVTEWSGLATSDVFDVDGGAASSVQQSSLRVSTSAPTKFANDLVYAWFDNTQDEKMKPGKPYKTVLQFFRGNLNSGTTENTPGVQTATASWTGNDDWYAVVAAIKTEGVESGLRAVDPKSRLPDGWPYLLLAISAPGFLYFFFFHKRTQLAAFAVLCGVSIVLWWHSLITTLRLALGGEAYTQILLIVPLTIALIYMQWRVLPGPLHPRSFESSAAVGSLLLAGALAIAGFARWGAPGLADDLRLSCSMIALVTWWIASVVFCFGVRAFRLFLFPLCFLFWMVPIPAAGLDWIVPFLQNESALTARVLFWMAGTPATQQGTVLDIPGLTIEVARECSSIRSSLLLIVMTMVLAHLFLSSWWRKAALIAAAIPLMVAKNGLRIFVIAELGTRVDPGFLDGKLHHHGGVVFLAIAVAIVIVLIWILRRSESSQSRVISEPPS